MLKGPLGASGAKEWNVQKLSVSGNPCGDSGSSDELKCQILQYTSYSCHTRKNQNNITKVKLQPNKNVLFRGMM